MIAAAEPRLGGAFVGSVLLHGGLIALCLFLRPGAPPPMPPIYKVELLGGPAAPTPSVGVVETTPVTPPVETPTPPKALKAPAIPAKPKPLKAKAKTHPTVKAATPLPPVPTPKAEPRDTTPPPAAGSIAGGKGADVTTVTTPGLDFPYPWYTQNIVRVIVQRFEQSPVARAALTADVRFIIRRDGSVDPNSIQLVTRSGNYSFDTQAQGAVESAANAHAFGPLPPGFHEDILPVTFRFSPQLRK